jgi:hypothetical protein
LRRQPSASASAFGKFSDCLDCPSSSGRPVACLARLNCLRSLHAQANAADSHAWHHPRPVAGAEA